VNILLISKLWNIVYYEHPVLCFEEKLFYVSIFLNVNYLWRYSLFIILSYSIHFYLLCYHIFSLIPLICVCRSMPRTQLIFTKLDHSPESSWYRIRFNSCTLPIRLTVLPSLPRALSASPTGLISRGRCLASEFPRSAS
jgi:hypothetical protein